MGWILLPFCLLLSGNDASSDSETSSDLAPSDRPTFAESTYPVRPGILQVESGIQIPLPSFLQEPTLLNLLVKTGLSSRTDLHAFLECPLPQWCGSPAGGIRFRMVWLQGSRFHSAVLLWSRFPPGGGMAVPVSLQISSFLTWELMGQIEIEWAQPDPRFRSLGVWSWVLSVTRHADFFVEGVISNPPLFFLAGTGFTGRIDRLPIQVDGGIYVQPGTYPMRIWIFAGFTGAWRWKRVYHTSTT